MQPVFRRYRLFLGFLILLFLITGVCPAVPNGTESLITTDTPGSFDSTPAVYGSFIAYVENQNVLYMNNLASGDVIPLPVSDPMLYYPAQPALSQDTVIWQEWDGMGSARIVRYDIPGGSIQQYYDAAYDTSDPFMPEFTFPKTDGDTIVWQNYNTTNSDWDIAVVRPGSSGPDLILYSLFNEKHPAVSGNSVVYENWTDTSHAEVWQFNLSDNTSVPLSPVSDLEISPQISGNRVVWQARNTSDTLWHVDLWENGITRRLTPSGISQERPALYGNRVVVEDYRRYTSFPEIYLYQISPVLTETWVAPNDLGASQSTPAIWNDRIVWEDSRAGSSCGGCDSDIYLFTLGSADLCPVADFSPSASAGADPLEVIFTDRSSGGPILYRIWNYTDGMTSYPLNPSGQTFSGAGIYHAKVTVGNLKCRNTTPAGSRYDIYVDTPPDAGFSGIPLEGFAPLTVQFTDSSGGEPATWTWDFGDGSVSHQQNPRHTYTSAGTTYTVTLTVNNTFAGMTPDSESKTDYIRTFLGATGTSAIPVEGIVVVPRYGGLFLIYNATILPDMAVPVPVILTTFHPDSAGWQNITFFSSDSSGFSDTFGNNTYMGNLSQVIFQTEDVISTGISPGIGTGWGINYRQGLPNYPAPASISTEIWENTTASDRTSFRMIAIGSNFIENPSGIAYTARITKSGFPQSGNATLNMSVDSTWIGGKEDSTYVIGYGVNSEGNTVGSVIPAQYLFSDGALDYFEAEVPAYFTRFGISPLSGSGNPLQLITLTVTRHIEPPSPNPASPDSGSDSGSGAAQGAATAAATPAPPAPAVAQVQQAATAQPQATAGSAITYAATPAEAKAPVLPPASQQPGASPPNSAVSIFTGVISWIATAVGGNPVVAAVIVVAGLAVYLFRKG